MAAGQDYSMRSDAVGPDAAEACRGGDYQLLQNSHDAIVILDALLYGFLALPRRQRSMWAVKFFAPCAPGKLEEERKALMTREPHRPSSGSPVCIPRFSSLTVATGMSS